MESIIRFSGFEFANDAIFSLSSFLLGVFSAFSTVNSISVLSSIWFFSLVLISTFIQSPAQPQGVFSWNSNPHFLRYLALLRLYQNHISSPERSEAFASAVRAFAAFLYYLLAVPAS